MKNERLFVALGAKIIKHAPHELRNSSDFQTPRF